MKRLLTIGLMLVSAFALTNCAEEIAAPVQDDITVDGNIENITPPEEEVNIPFEVFATVGGEAKTKTQNIGNGTYWVCEDDKKDQISVFHYNHESAKSTAISKMTHNKPFTIKDVKGIFEGGLSNTLGDTNDWYFLYPYGENYTIIEGSSSGSTLTVSGVQIGAQTINQALINTIDKNITLAANSKAYICNKLSPMFGHLPNRPRNEQPEIEMKHLAAIVAIKVVNDGFGGDIKIKDVEFAVPDVYKTDNNGKIVLGADGNPTKLQDAFPIVGQFQVNMANGQCTAISDNSFASTKFELPSAVSLAKGGSITFYLPVMPFSAKKTISIKVNSSERAISKSVKLESGKVTTFKVPITPLAHETRSDAFEVRSVGRETTDDQSHTTGNTYIAPDGETAISSTIITTTGERQNIVINGQSVEAYKLSDSQNTITITGFLPDLLKALPVGFYVSTWGNEPAVMTVNNITAWLPKYAKSEKKVDEEWVSGGIIPDYFAYYDITTDFNTINRRGGAETNALALIAGGSSYVKLEPWMLNLFGDSVSDKITFSNISQNGYYDNIFKNSNIVVLNDEFTHKEVNETNLTTFLKSFTSGGKTATFEGLMKIATAAPESLPASLVYSEKRKGKLNPVTQSTTLITQWPPKDGEGNLCLDSEIINTIDAIYGRIKNINVANVTTAITEIPTQYHLLHMLRDVKVSVKLGTTSAGPTIVIWGLDATTPPEMQKAE